MAPGPILEPPCSLREIKEASKCSISLEPTVGQRLGVVLLYWGRLAARREQFREACLPRNGGTWVGRDGEGISSGRKVLNKGEEAGKSLGVQNSKEASGEFGVG